jgi:hypothetical protein
MLYSVKTRVRVLQLGRCVIRVTTLTHFRGLVQRIDHNICTHTLQSGHIQRLSVPFTVVLQPLQRIVAAARGSAAFGFGCCAMADSSLKYSS